MAPSPGVFTLLSADDLYLFNQGTHYRLHDKLGAHVVRAGDAGVNGPAPVDGTYFAVWAPNASRVSVIGDWNSWQADATPLSARESSGIWEGLVPGVSAGTRYKYRITTAAGVGLEKADPVAAYAELAPATASVVWNGSHEWRDAAWMQTRAAANSRAAAMSIYEVHLGSWRRKPDGTWMGYRELGHALAEHCTNLGFTHVELMPVMEHPFYGSWGYQVTGYFAPTARYGRPEDLMDLVDTLHQRNIGVILDWVPAHFPTDAHGLGEFDGTHLYEHADPRRGFHRDWTSFIFNFARHEVQSFLMSSAIAWLDRFHADGLRVDGVASMLYRDYSRGPGEWVPDVDGSNHDRDAIAFLQQLNRAVYAAFPDTQMIAEESTAWGGVSRPPEVGGLGFGLKWDLGWMHDTLDYLKRDPIHRRHHHDRLTFRALYHETENFVLPLSHDEVVHGKGALVAKFPGDDWQKLATLRLLLGYQWTLPGKKLLFMGGELGVWREWNHDDSLDWELGRWPAHSGIARWLGDLNKAYRAYPALHRKDCEPGGFAWTVADDAGTSVLAYLRRGEAGDPPILVACNFTPVPRHDYVLDVPHAGRWVELLNSDAALYGGSNLGNQGGVVAHGGRIAITMPPLGCVVFRGDGP
ncbi:MAG: 1,4-alpha-glucan branching protein GlgB [Deltaproteobacteria bacterium]|nr:1,4-alpha-glucan branching protein GlgB [Deltaproteobacteria bacterium]